MFLKKKRGGPKKVKYIKNYQHHQVIMTKKVNAAATSEGSFDSPHLWYLSSSIEETSGMEVATLHWNLVHGMFPVTCLLDRDGWNLHYRLLPPVTLYIWGRFRST